MFLLLIVDVLVIQLSSFLGLWIRFDMQISRIPGNYVDAVTQYAVINTIFTLAVFFILRLYSFMWSVAGMKEELHIVIACILSSLFQISGMTMLELRVPRSYFGIFFVSLAACETVVRLSYRIGRSLRSSYGKAQGKRVMIVGAGTSGSMILKEMMTSTYTDGYVVCFVDDDKNKQGKFLNGIPIAGMRDDIPKLAEHYEVEEIYIAMPSAPGSETRKILEICRETDCELKILPGIYQLLNGDVSVSKLRKIEIEDLLGREPIRVNLNEIMGYVSNKVILVTGGGGSIGSELCRQIASHNPKQLIVFDVYENNAYDLQQELKRAYPELNLVVLIGSVRNTHRVESVLDRKSVV